MKSLDPKQLSIEAQELQRKIQSKVIAQDRAIKQFITVHQSLRAGLNPSNRPLGVLLFLGPTGTGKTESVRQFCQAVFDNPDAFLKIDCAELKKDHMTARLIGSPHGYTGFNESPQITQEKLDKFKTKEHPFSVLLLDEIEQADDAVFDLFLGVFDSGKLTLGNASVVDFSKTLIVMTSNLGAEEVKREIEEAGIGFHSDDRKHEDVDKKIYTISRDAARKRFRPQFLNRVDRMVVFRSLPGWALERILDLKITAVQEHLINSAVPVTLDVQPSAKQFLLDEGVSVAYGGREIQRSVRKYLIAPLSNLISGDQLEIGDRVVVSHSRGKELAFKSEPGVLLTPKPKDIFEPLGGTYAKEPDPLTDSYSIQYDPHHQC